MAVSNTELALMKAQERAVQPAPPLPEAIEAAILEGDFMKLKPEHRVFYYRSMCDSVGLNWMTRPFDLMKDDGGKYRPYARKEAAEQLRKLHRVSVRTIERTMIDEEIFCVTVQATLPDGRTEDSQGMVALGQLKGQARANAMMRAETKAKRRVTLSIVGLGWTMIDDEPRAGSMTHFDPLTGEIEEVRDPIIKPVGLMAPRTAPAVDETHGSGSCESWHTAFTGLWQAATRREYDHGRVTAWLKNVFKVESPQDLSEAQLVEATKALATSKGLNEKTIAYLCGDIQSTSLLSGSPLPPSEVIYEALKDTLTQAEQALTAALEASEQGTPLPDWFDRLQRQFDHASPGLDDAEVSDSERHGMTQNLRDLLSMREQVGVVGGQ